MGKRCSRRAKVAADAFLCPSASHRPTCRRYAVVVKKREKGRVVEASTRVVYGSEAQVAAALQASRVSETINTYGVERNNLTVRQHSRRMTRKARSAPSRKIGPTWNIS